MMKIIIICNSIIIIIIYAPNIFTTGNNKALKQDSTISSPTLDESLYFSSKTVSTSSAQNCTFS